MLILVTGATGVTGAELVRRLSARYAAVFRGEQPAPKV